MNTQSPSAIVNEPGVPVIRNINLVGLKTLYIKEVRRFFKVQLQTIWGPAITTALFLVIFTVALGGGKREVLGHPFGDFIAPGLIMMGMMQNAFANSSFSLLVGKMQGTIVDYLMPPLSSAELLIALIAGAMTRAVLVGGAEWIVRELWPGVHVMPVHLWAVVLFGVLGTAMLSLIGVLTSIWAEKFDQSAAVGTFLIGPASLLSGTFYSIDKLAPAFQVFSRFNPFHYAISGFRYGFIGVADSPLLAGALVLLAINLILGGTCYALLRTGWRLKA
ncbi:MAG: multidrug transporter permease [Sphingomonadales bacterium]|nr:multidrug transporter permease [Sphingomonadales bacterium]